MKVALNIKNLSKLKQPQENDVIIYDGKEWYVTTKEEILKESLKLVSESQKTLKELKEENEKFKKELTQLNEEFKTKISKDIIDITEIAKKLLELKGDNL